MEQCCGGGERVGACSSTFSAITCLGASCDKDLINNSMLLTRSSRVPWACLISITVLVRTFSVFCSVVPHGEGDGSWCDSDVST